MPLKEVTSKHFFGRNNEIDTLRNIASQACSGDSNSIILLGKRGIGKTELLKHLFSDLFNGQSDSIPFLYTVNAAYASIENFSKDYLSCLILQSLAFIKQEATLIKTGSYSLEEVMDIAEKSEAAWASNIIKKYFHMREAEDPIKLLSFVISVPCLIYCTIGMPVVVIIDDFHKIKKILEFGADDYSKDLWMCFEKAICFQYAPHIFAGLQADLHRMFFEDTSFGEHLEVITLSGLGMDDAFGLFGALCEKHELGFEAELKNHIEIFCGNPFYVKSFVQGARHTVRSLTENNYWEIYIREITTGKINTYWTSILNAYFPRFESRRPVLNVLYHICVNNPDDVYVKLRDMLAIERKELDHIIDLLHISGTLDMGFSTIEFTDDTVLADVVKVLYYKEILKESSDKIKEVIIKDKTTLLTSTAPPAFDITIPSTPKAELVAVQSLEQIARYFNLPSDTTGQLQISLAELFSGVLVKNGTSGGSYQIKFFLKDNVFSIEIITSQKDLALTDDDRKHIRPYIDDIRVEEIIGGSRIILYKELKENLAAAS